MSRRPKWFASAAEADSVTRTPARPRLTRSSGPANPSVCRPGESSKERELAKETAQQGMSA